jgi:hypothetical protein
MKAFVSVCFKNSLKGREVPLYIISLGIFSAVTGIAVGVDAGSITCQGINVGVLDAGAKPSFIDAMGSG